MIQTRDSGDSHWSWITDFGSKDRLVIGRGVVDDAVGSPRVFGRATFRAYLDKLVAQAPAAVDYYLFDDDHGTDWRILVWDVPTTGYDQRSTVPPPGDPLRAGYALALAIEGGEPHYVGTWNGVDVRKRLRDLAVRAEASRTREAVPRVPPEYGGNGPRS
ncbi:hypothetical protein AB0J63_43150 [Streptosporangium canum]|uniref:hypothetical protein n=1 Tax=Streptosporangium canum TaxID=324952 RepID=UPI00343F735C